MSTQPAGTDKAPNFVVLVQSSLRVIAIAITAPDMIRTIGPAMVNCSASGLSMPYLSSQRDRLFKKAQSTFWCGSHAP
jgi:hypothetical protein